MLTNYEVQSPCLGDLGLEVGPECAWKIWEIKLEEIYQVYQIRKWHERIKTTLKKKNNEFFPTVLSLIQKQFNMNVCDSIIASGMPTG